jgi:glyoxylase-like metal-dependent hydrolase (beta-lactamase superfamily II)
MQIGEIAAEGVLRIRTLMVNVYIVRTGNTWVLVDGGLRGYSRVIMDAAAGLTGSRTPPAALVLTHGHFDHIG